MGLLWRFGVLLASWGCLGARTGSAQEQLAGTQGAGGNVRRRWDERTCHWLITVRIVEGNRTLGLKELDRRSLPDRLQVILEVEGNRLLLNLVQNGELLAADRGLTYYLPNGTRVTHWTSRKGNCCYRGSIQEHPDSSANICFCSGLSGLLAVSEDRSYSLESGVDGTTAYRLHAVRQETGECRLRLQPEAQRSFLRRTKRDAEAEPGYVELVMVADRAEFELDPDLDRTHTRMLEIASYMDGYYRPLGLRVGLVGVEIWNTGNRVSLDGPPRAALERFLEWKQRDLLPRIPHDSAQLITGSPFTSGAIGASTQSSICSKRSGGISMDHSVSPLVMASTLSHQLGHNLGLHHVGAGCGCDGSNPNLPPGRSCIMEPPTGLMPGQSFSSCSHQQLERILRSSRVWCLLDVPDPAHLVESRCGNHLVESGEDCDCGLREECTDPCCNASTCQLKPEAECATGGACCHECKLRSAGYLCRKPQNECDLPEFCSGDSARCPVNVYKQNGTPCEGGKAVCYGGACPTYSSQCQEFWGSGSIAASDACVASLNSRGDVEGHCGQRADGSYIPCAQRDVRCGRLQCQGGSASPGKPNRTASLCPHNTPTPVDDTLDLAMVLPGTACGSNMVCVDQKCRDLSVLNVTSCQCHGHGVCNSNGHCHCYPGWAPPDCQGSGPGGSIDSGTPAAEQAGRATSKVLLVIILLLVLLLVVGLCWAKRIRLHKRLCQFGKGTSCQYSAAAESRVRIFHPAEERGINHPEPRSYSRPERPRPPQWRGSTELHLMSSSKPPCLGATRPDPPSKPLPPDPVPKGQQALVQDRPAPPTRPLPADPIPKDAQPPAPAKPPPPQRPLPLDPPRAELGARSDDEEPRILMVPSRPAPPPPPVAAGSSLHIHQV